MRPFEEALTFTLKWEGGFIDHPADPGGKTFRGVTEESWRAWLAVRNRVRPGRSREVARATPNKVRQLYLDGYWHPSHASDLTAPLCIVQFDAAVHSGPSRAIRLLQSAAGVPHDGIWGPQTRRATCDMDPVTLAREAVSRRRSFLLSLIVNRPTLGTFRKGWLNRLADLEALIGEWAVVSKIQAGR